MSKKLEKLTEIIRKEVTNIISEARKKAGKKKKPKKPTMEGMTVESHKQVGKDELGKFWVVLNPMNGRNKENIVFETDLFNFAEKFSNKGVTFEDVRAIVREQGRAKKLSEKFLRERENAIRETTAKAVKLKNLKNEVEGKIGELKKNKVETVSAVQALKSGKVNENKAKGK